MIKAIIFDMDGVVIDSTEKDFAAWKKTLKEQGVEISFGDYQKFLGRTGTDIVKQYLKDKDDKEAYNIGNKKEEYFLQSIEDDGIKLNPGIIAFFKRLGESYKKALATAASTTKVTVILEKLNLNEFFDAVVTANDVKKGKPNPETFLKSAEKLGVKPYESVVIEDAPNGIEAAKAGGMKCIAITTTHSRKQLTGADIIIDSFSEINIDDIKNL